LRWLGGQKNVRDEIGELLEFSGLGARQEELAANLSFGEQRRLELARALATRPSLLLLDEPAAGMNSEEIGQLRERIVKLRSRGITIVLVEHVMELVMGVADRIAVLNFGRKIAEGTPAEIRSDPLVKKAYLGGA
jgi:ABC-type branched-subunit amino acid transport system ATPase component